jgi:dihydrofolate synthase / folylpolyglutamate synthase
VVEAGVGARSDATMALPGVVGTVLTNVDLDHVETIGPTLLDVARDKAAVARHGVPLVTGARGEALALVLAMAAADVGAPVWVVDAAQALARWPEGGPQVDATGRPRASRTRARR